MSETSLMLADYHVFAEDLFCFVKLQFCTPNNLHIVSKHLKRLSTLSNAIRCLVLYHIQRYEVEVRNIFNYLQGNLNANFGDFTKEMVSAICSRKFRQADLLLFCSIISMLAVLAYNSSYKNCTAKAVAAMVSVFHYFQTSGEFTKDNWKKFGKAEFVY